MARHQSTGTALECCPPLGAQRLSESASVDLARMFKALGDPVRLRLLSMITSAPDGEICVCELTEGFDVSGPTISHHLRVLREAGLVDGDRRGTWVYYRPRPGSLRHLAALLDVATPVTGSQRRQTSASTGSTFRS